MICHRRVADVKAAPVILVWVLDMYERITNVLADKGYPGTIRILLAHYFAAQGQQVDVEISQRSNQTKGFQVEPKRWIGERTWAWLEYARILTRDYERLQHKSSRHDLSGHDPLNPAETNKT